MVDKRVLEELRDLTQVLNKLVEELASKGEDLTSQFRKAGRQALDLGAIFDRLVARGKGIPENISSGRDLMDALKKKTVEYSLIRKKVFDMQRRELNEYWKKVERSLEIQTGKQGLSLKLTKEYQQAELEMTMLREKTNRDLDTGLTLLSKRREEVENIKASFFDMSNAMNRLGGAIRNPSKAMDGMLAVFGRFPKDLVDSANKTGSLGAALKGKVGGALKGIAKTGKMLLGPAGLLVLGLTAALAPIILVWKAFKELWGHTERVTKQSAFMNKELGNMGPGMGQLRKQMSGTGVQFELLGKSFEEGTQAVTKLASSMMRVEFTKEQLDTGLKLAEYVGLGAEQSGKLMLAFEKSGTGIGKLNEGMKSGAKEATKWGVPINQVRRDIGENIDILQRFGTQNVLTFSESAAKARSYGLSIKEVNASFGEQMDTFEGTSDAAAKLNAIFGTQVNSMKLMMETNPQKRMEMLRKELLSQGKTWEDLNVFEQNVITSTLKVNKQQAAMILSSDKARKSLEAQAKEQKNLDRINREWDKGLGNIKQTMVAWTPILNKLLRSVANFTAKLFGLGTGSKPIREVAKAMEEMGNKTTEFIDNIPVEKIRWFFGIFSDIANVLEKIVEFSPVGMFKKMATLPFDLFKEGGALENPQGAAESSTVGKALNFFVEGNKQLFKNIVGTQDALITKKGEVIKFSPKDNILATQSPIARTAAGATATAGARPAESKSPEIIQVNLHLDGKKISESQVRISRN